jgi:hypothetical protein
MEIIIIVTYVDVICAICDIALVVQVSSHYVSHKITNTTHSETSYWTEEMYTSQSLELGGGKLLSGYGIQFSSCTGIGKRGCVNWTFTDC